jgi:hypothetical protein
MKARIYANILWPIQKLKFHICGKIAKYYLKRGRVYADRGDGKRALYYRVKTWNMVVKRDRILEVLKSYNTIIEKELGV